VRAWRGGVNPGGAAGNRPVTGGIFLLRCRPPGAARRISREVILGDTDTAELARRIAALEKQNADLDAALKAARKEISDHLDLIEKSVQLTVKGMDDHDADQKKVESELRKGQEDLLKMTELLEKRMDEPDKVLAKEIDRLDGRVRDLEGKVAKLGKK
jgi:hypothetical protein